MIASTFPPDVIPDSGSQTYSDTTESPYATTTTGWTTEGEVNAVNLDDNTLTTNNVAASETQETGRNFIFTCQLNQVSKQAII